MSEPKQWIISKRLDELTTTKLGQAYSVISDIKGPSTDDAINVIEKSAYDELKLKYEELLKSKGKVSVSSGR